MIKHSVARCGKCGRPLTWKQVAEIASRPKIEATIRLNLPNLDLILRIDGMKYIYYAALGKENEIHKPNSPRH